MTDTLLAPTCKEIAATLIHNFSASAPFYLEVGNRSDLVITSMDINKDDEGRCILSVRVEDIAKA